MVDTTQEAVKGAATDYIGNKVRGAAGVDSGATSRKQYLQDQARFRAQSKEDYGVQRKDSQADYQAARADFLSDRESDRGYAEDIYQQRTNVESRADAANPVLVGDKLGGDHAAYMDAAYPGTNPWERLGVSNTGYSGGATGMIGNATTQASGDRTQMRVQQAQMSLELVRAKMSTDAQIQSSQISADAQIESARISAGASGYVADTGADASRYGTDMQRQIGLRQTEAQLRQAGVSEKQLRINERNLERIIDRWPTEKKQMLAQAALAEQQTAHSQAMQPHDVRAKQYGMLAPAYAVYKELQKSDGFGQVMDVLLPVLGVGAAAKFATSQALRFGKKWAGKKPRTHNEFGNKIPTIEINRPTRPPGKPYSSSSGKSSDKPPKGYRTWKDYELAEMRKRANARLKREKYKY